MSGRTHSARGAAPGSGIGNSTPLVCFGSSGTASLPPSDNFPSRSSSATSTTRKRPKQYYYHLEIERAPGNTILLILWLLAQSSRHMPTDTCGNLEISQVLDGPAAPPPAYVTTYDTEHVLYLHSCAGSRVRRPQCGTAHVCAIIIFTAYFLPEAPVIWLTTLQTA